ncbi:hypothetical protein HYT59_01010 [Candidatus Woesebacteria bacterium]|nr:hypothetical protein [Candidatus Woesebacteria bacterium]
MVAYGMPQVSKHLMAPKIAERVYKVFIDSIKNTRSHHEVITFLNDLLTPTEKTMLAKRVAIAFLLLEGDYNYRYISKTLKVSAGTIARVHTTLILQGMGFQKILGSMIKRKTLKIVFEELLESLTPLPPKGSNWGEWKKGRAEAKRKRQEPL